MSGDGGDRSDRPSLRVLIAAGGSGGHVFPGVALARALKEYDPNSVVHFAGTSRGLETRAIPEAGFPLELLPILPLFRRPSVATVAAPFAAVWSALAAMRLVRRESFDVVCGMGAYVSLPVAVGAWWAGVPVIVHEQNAVPGLANRLAARVARTVALGFDEASAALPVPSERMVVVGNPIRPELARLDRGWHCGTGRWRPSSWTRGAAPCWCSVGATAPNPSTRR